MNIEDFVSLSRSLNKTIMKNTEIFIKAFELWILQEGKKDMVYATSEGGFTLEEILEHRRRFLVYSLKDCARSFFI